MKKQPLNIASLRLTSRINTIIITLLALTQFTACSTSVQNATIPVGNDNNDIAEAAETLGVSEDKLKTYFDCINTTYDVYINNLETQNQSLETFKETIEENYDCTFGEYIDAFIIVSHDEKPDESYTLFESKYSLYDAYIPSSELNDDRTLLKNYDIEIYKVEDNQDIFVFDTIISCNGDFGVYMNALSEYTECTSVELKNTTIHGHYGVTKPEEPNACLDKFFVYDEKSNEIIEKLTVPMLTLHFENKEDVTYALSNELGIFFKTEGSDSIKKMCAINKLNFQIRHNV